MPRNLTVVDLFSGAGGFSLGFHAAGCKVIAAVDVDEASGTTFEENFVRLQPEAPPRVLKGDEGDMEDLDLDSITGGEAPDILIGGPPCQGFSRVGRGKLDSLSEEGFAGDPRNSLYRRFVGALQRWRPMAFVMENVAGMLSVKGRNVANEAAVDLAACGYRVGYALLNAAWYGVPQSRERIIFVGVRDDLDELPVLPRTTHELSSSMGMARHRVVSNLPLGFFQDYELEVHPAHHRQRATTVAEAIDDLPRILEHLDPGNRPPRGDFRLARTYYGPPRSAFARLMRNWPGLTAPIQLVDHVTRRTPRDFETFRRMQPGDRYPEALVIARTRRDEALAKLHADGCAPAKGTLEYEEFERRFVPPYPEDEFLDKWRKLIPDQPSWTVPAHLSKDAYSHIHHDSEQARSISIREAARLQSFPDGYTFTGSMGDCYRQIGNAVPPLFSWVIACSLLRALHLEPRSPRLSPERP